jgi:hypothetical protein
MNHTLAWSLELLQAVNENGNKQAAATNSAKRFFAPMAVLSSPWESSTIPYPFSEIFSQSANNPYTMTWVSPGEA